MASCSQCHNSMEPEDQFCTQCGAAAPRLSAHHGEPILGVIPQVVEVKGILGLSTKFMTLVVTPRRLILAEQPYEMNDQHTEYEWKIEDHISKNATTWREFMQTTDFSSAPWSGYQSMSAAEIMAEQPHNRSIPIEAIDDLLLELYSDEEDHMDSIKLTTGGALLDLTLPWGNGLEAQKILAQVKDMRVVHT